MFERQRALPRAPLQDAIPRVGKFGTLFRRPGQRVIVDYHGDIVVRPSPHEIQLRNGAPLAAAVPRALSGRSGERAQRRAACWSLPLD
jgi:hypothetical protein